MRIFPFIWIILFAKSVWADGDPARGEKRFEECAACHTLERGANGVGPSLKGVFERTAGESPNFLYSPAMRRSKIKWTPQAMDEFVADPQKMVPANRMPYAGMPEARDREDLIAYLLKAAK
jgi:cytochrome c2